MKYRKKPVIVEAFQVTKEMILDDSFPKNCKARIGSKHWHPGRRKLFEYKCKIETLEGDMKVLIGDWIITGVNGEQYPCKPDIFEKSYEPV